MRFSTVIVSALATLASAAPAEPRLDLKGMPNPADAIDNLSAYFNLLAARVQAAKVMAVPPKCDLSKAVMPVAPVALPAPSQGLSVHHVAVGRGTQNYTCDAGNANAKPEAAGAVAALFNASCLAATHPDVLEMIPGVAVHFPLDQARILGPSPLSESGMHYFTGPKTPFFDLDVTLAGKEVTIRGTNGHVSTAKLNDTAAPPNAAHGVGGELAVPWLKLGSVPGTLGTTNNIKEVYRVNTAGGSAPATCKDQAATFQVQYAAVYWFYAGDVVAPTTP
jgi:hypothetical protein